MRKGNPCAKHPELEGVRHNGGNCPACVKEYRQKHAWRSNAEQRAQKAREYRQANAEHLKANNARWRAENKARVAENNLKRTGFTVALLKATLERQGFRCGICKCDLSALPRKLVHADHCHKTGVARGVLCHYCNIALGAFRDDPGILTLAIAYLNNPPLALA